MEDLPTADASLRSVNVTIYVAPGDYYLFNCFGKFVEKAACELQTEATDWCLDL